MAEARHIALFLHDLPLGGTERIAIRLANRWAAQGRRVTMLCGTTEGPLSALLSPEVDMVECDPPIRRARRSRTRLGKALSAFLVERSPDVLFVPGNYQWPALPEIWRIPERLRPPAVVQISTPLYRRGRDPVRQAIFNIKVRGQLRGAEALVSLSPAMTRDADRILRREITRCILLPALDDETGLQTALHPAQGRTIVAAGRLMPVKAFDVAIRAFASLDLSDARLVIVGEGPERRRLERLARDLGVADRVALPGYAQDIGPWLSQARVFLLSSHFEGYAAVVVEALAAGRPVVATRCTRAVIDLLDRPDHGAVAPVGDVGGLAAALKRVMTSPAPDPAHLAQAVSAYRIGPVAEQYLALFDEVVRARRARPIIVR